MADQSVGAGAAQALAVSARGDEGWRRRKLKADLIVIGGGSGGR